MIKFIPEVKTSDITGAVYNPRKITTEGLTKLQESLKLFGMVKPLIINSANNTIVAGHQRKKAAEAIGMETVPCLMIKTPNMQDEIHFNILHNSIETSQIKITLEEYKLNDYYYCPSAKIKINSKPTNLLICSEITRLLSQYGEWGSVVADEEGRVILNAEYAYCAKKMGFGVLVYTLPMDKVESFMEYMGVEYGKYNYDNIGVKTYHQFKAQLRRRSTDGRRKNTSYLYENILVPMVTKSDSIIDVGAGRMAYMKMLKSQGYDIHAYEPSLMAKGSNSLDMKGIIANILDAEKAVKDKGLFDFCILEFVINSIVDDDFERAVLTLCNATIKADGTFITCTRNLDSVTKASQANTQSMGKGISLYCLDEKNYSLSISNGIAFKQKFHTRESYVALLERFFECVDVVRCTDASIYCVCTKPKQLTKEEYEIYLEKELNIEYPGGFKHNKHKGLMNALIKKVGERYG